MNCSPALLPVHPVMNALLSKAKQVGDWFKIVTRPRLPEDTAPFLPVK
jgi:hypothetical protein